MDISQPAPSGGEMGVIVIGGDADRVMDDATVGATGVDWSIPLSWFFNFFSLFV
jgi:hypothetical protein